MTIGNLALIRHINQSGSTLSSYTSTPINHSLTKSSMKRHLLDAICYDEFDLVYQPQTDISGHLVVGVEALLRWNSPALGPVLPTEFIPLAEESGLILDIGKLVIEKACAQASLWEKQYGKSVRIAINVSYVQVHDAAIVEFIQSCLSKYSLSVSALEIELTESSLIKDTSKVIGVLNDFKDLGIRTAIDDFGTGYSSLSYLASMPFSLIKIDRSFISQLGSNATNTIITESIIELSKKLNMEVLAEGVETELQKRFLIENSCDLMQGNLFSCPVSADKIPALAGMQLC